MESTSGKKSGKRFGKTRAEAPGQAPLKQSVRGFFHLQLAVRIELDPAFGHIPEFHRARIDAVEQMLMSVLGGPQR